MSYANFKPNVHVANYLHELEDKLVFAQLCTRAYDGEVSKLGQKIVFKGIGDPTITALASKTGLLSAGTVEQLEDTSMVMEVNKADTFYFAIGDIDAEEAAEGGGVLAKGRQKAARQQAVKIDKYIAELIATKQEAQKVYAAGSEPALEKATILGIIDNVVQEAETRGMSGGDLFAIIPPRFKKLLKQAYVDLDTDNSAMIKNGYVGTYNGVHFVLSNNVYKTGTANTTSEINYIPVFTRDAIAYAHPFSKIEAERPDGAFYDAVKGLTLYDAKIIYPKEVMVLNVKYASAAL